MAAPVKPDAGGPRAADDSPVPPESSASLLGQHVNVRFSTAEYDALCSRAMYEGISLSSLIRQTALRYLADLRTPPSR